MLAACKFKASCYPVAVMSLGHHLEHEVEFDIDLAPNVTYVTKALDYIVSQNERSKNFSWK